MKNRSLVIVGLILLMGLTLSACGVVDDLSTVSDTGKAFMTALKDGDPTTSWNMLTTDVQEEIGGEEVWAEWTAIRNFPEWKFTNTEVDNNYGQMDGEATLDGTTYKVTLVFDKVDDTWKISGINFE